MLKRVDRNLNSRPEYGAEFEIPKSDGPLDLDLWLGVVRRQARVLVVAALAGLLVGFAYIVTAVPQYTATTQLLIDNQLVANSQRDNNDVSASTADLLFETGAIDSQVEVLKSGRIAHLVVSSLKLTSDPEFMKMRETLIGRALAMLRPAFDLGRLFAPRTKSEPDSEPDDALQRAAISKLENGLGVRRIARTYVLAVDYTSPNPKLAATIADAFAEAYLADQLDAKFEASRRTSDWMRERIAQLKKDSINSDSAVQKFKAVHGLVTADGKLVSDQQLTELTAQLMAAHNDTAKAEARSDQITEMLKSGETDGSVTDSLGNPVITDLRQKFLHASLIGRQRDVEFYRKQIFEELKRIAETYRSESEIAKAKEDSLKKSMAALTSENVETDETLVQLRELEREAENYRTLYQTFLRRYQDTVQHQSAPMSEARVITAASQPSVPSSPRRTFILAFSLVLGSMVGVGIGAVMEHRGGRVFRTPSQVRDQLGLEFLGMLQVLDHPAIFTKPSVARPDPKKIASKDCQQRYSIDHPLSHYSETLRSIKLAVDLSLSDRQPKVIGVISTFPNEGKTTLSKNFASCLAQLGATTLLIDGDLRDFGLTRSLAAHADAGILEAIRGDRPLRDLLLLEPDSGLLVLPAVIRKRLHHPGEVLSSPGMRSLLTEAGEDFDYIIVDLPPIAAVLDVRAAASMFDAFILLVEWGRTALPAVQTIVASDKLLYDKCVGVVFNKVQMNKITLYESYGSKDSYHGDVSKYYRETME